jgi:hypothetical protein
MREVVGFHLKIRAFVLKALYTHIYIIIIIIKIIIIYIYALYIYMHQFYITKCLLPGELTSSVATVVTGQPYIYMHIHELFNNIYIYVYKHIIRNAGVPHSLKPSHCSHMQICYQLCESFWVMSRHLHILASAPWQQTWMEGGLGSIGQPIRI